MKVAIVGSRTLQVADIENYIPEETVEIVSGGAKGIDTCAKTFAQEKGMKYTEFLPEYDKYGRAAPIKRNDTIISYADLVIIFWNGKSKGTRYVKEKCEKESKAYKLIVRGEES